VGDERPGYARHGVDNELSTPAKNARAWGAGWGFAVGMRSNSKI
jgi:hypothetical protein